TGLITPEMLFLLTLVLGAATAAAQPARLSLVPSLVARDDIPSAVAVNSVGWNSARFVGPTLAGPLLLHFGPVTGAGWAFLCNTASFAVFLIILPMLRFTPRPKGQREHQSLFAEIGEGFRYIARHAGVSALILLLLTGALLVRPYVELLPAFADVAFEQGAEGFSMLIAVNGLGALAGGVWLAQRGRRRGLAAIVFGGAAVHAGMVALFSVTKDFHLALAVLGTAGFAMLVMGVGAQSLIQMGTPSDMLGRVLSIYGLSFRAGPALGALAMGALADRIGLSWPVLGGACLCLAVIILLLRRLQAVRATLER
ncbi:MAG: MFS transporter, partial [Alphaproteobacteria bacterium]|nr:MFS transporter [Alphaproteobacteria bacterium]